MKLWLLVTIMVLCQAAPAFAGKKFNTNENGVAIQGYDTVAYFTDKQAIEGKSKFSTEWQKATWHFSSKKNLTAFEKAPKKYAPQYGGFCAYAVSKGKKADIDPAAWSVVGKKLYFNNSKKVRTLWKQNSGAYIHVAEMKWPTMS